MSLSEEVELSWGIARSVCSVEGGIDSRKAGRALHAGEDGRDCDTWLLGRLWTMNIKGRKR